MPMINNKLKLHEPSKVQIELALNKIRQTILEILQYVSQIKMTISWAGCSGSLLLGKWIPGGLWLGANMGKKQDPISIHELGMMVCFSNPSYGRCVYIRGLWSRLAWAKYVIPYVKSN
jgi:hypothetical protein